MSALLRALMGQQVGGDKPNLAIDTDFTTPFDHLAGRSGTITAGRTRMEINKKYQVSCDLVINITETSENIFPMQLGGYGAWRSPSALGKPGTNEVGVFNRKIDYTGIYYLSNPNEWCRIDCGGLKGSIRFYNIVIAEV